MKGLVKESLEKDGLELRSDLPTPKPGPGEVKIRVLATSVCGTDKSIYASSKNDAIKNEMRRYSNPYQPIVIGHEFCGIIEEIGERADPEERNLNPKEVTFEVGDYVTAEMHLSCGFCSLCRTGNKHICTRVMVKGVHQDGCFADSVVVPHRNLIMLAKSGDTSGIPPRIAAMLDAFGNAVHTVSEADVRGKSVAILGAGPLGLMATMLCKHFGATKIYVSEVADVERRFNLAEKFGADQCFDVSKGSAKLDQAVEKFSPYSNGVDIVLELSGAVSAYSDAFRIIRNGGLVVLLGLGPKHIPDFDIAKGVIFKGVTIKGIFGRRMFETWEMMLGLLDCQRFGLQDGLEQILAKKDYPLKDYRQAFESLIAGDEMKLVFVP